MVIDFLLGEEGYMFFGPSTRRLSNFSSTHKRVMVSLSNL
jgi:hypothetical protein